MGERLADQRVSGRPPRLCQPLQPFPGLFINVDVEVQVTSEYNCSICYMSGPVRTSRFSRREKPATDMARAADQDQSTYGSRKIQPQSACKPAPATFPASP
jgi:hypothetical protein